MKILTALTIASLSISSSAYALDTSLLTIIFKIYEQASSAKIVQESTQPAAQPPENFAKSKQLPTVPVAGSAAIAPESSNLTVESDCNPFRDEHIARACELLKGELSARDRKLVEKAIASDNDRIEQDRAQRKYSQEQEATESGDYLVDFNKRNLTKKQFVKLYYGNCSGCIQSRNNVTLNNITDREKVLFEQRLEIQENAAKYIIKYHQAFQKHVTYVVKDLSLSFVELRALLIKGDKDAQEEFNLNPAGDAIQLKNIWAGVTNYEITHNLDTHCLYGLGGKNEFLPDCDKILAIITSDYAYIHKNISHTITKADLRKLAHAINPHETLD